MLLKALNKAFAIYAFIYAFIYAIIYAFKSLSKERPSKDLDAKALWHAVFKFGPLKTTRES